MGARRLRCGHRNRIKSLDISNNKLLTELDLSLLDSLRAVCVWTIPFPPDGVTVYKGPKVYFTTECSDLIAPIVTAPDSLYQADFLEALSSEDGVIYLVPMVTEKDLIAIRELALDSVMTVANAPANISFSGLANGIYWLYAIDAAGNISEPRLIAVMGVGIDKLLSNQIRIYPNPTNNLLTIESEYPDHYSFEITSLNGQQLFTDEMEGTSHQLDLSHLQKGVYFISIRSTDFISTKKIIKL